MARTEEMMGFAYRSALSLPNMNVMVVAATPSRVTYCLNMIKKKVDRDFGTTMLADNVISLSNGSTLRGWSVSKGGTPGVDLNLIVWDDIEDVAVTKLDAVLTDLLPMLAEREGHLVTSMDHSAEFFHRVFNSVIVDGTPPYVAPSDEELV